jgi:large subunit ribosomal protein L5
MNTNLREQSKEIKTDLIKQLALTSSMACPYIKKITVNVGLGQEAGKDDVEKVVADIARITGQKPIVTYVKNSEAGFKIRKGWPIGVKVTLRREKMYRFLEYVLLVCLPAVREFNGLNKKALDRQGNLSFGLIDYSVFRSIPYEQNRKRVGMDICVTTSARDQKSGFALLKLMGVPFKVNASGDDNGN